VDGIDISSSDHPRILRRNRQVWKVFEIRGVCVWAVDHAVGGCWGPRQELVYSRIKEVEDKFGSEDLLNISH